MIYLKNKLPKIEYEFLSLINDSDRNKIRQIIKKDFKSLVKFESEMPPVSPVNDKMQHICYITNKIEQLNIAATSIIKLNSKTMEMKQIYFSDFKIEHIQIREIQTKAELMEENVTEHLHSQLQRLVVDKNKEKGCQENSDDKKERSAKDYLADDLNSNAETDKEKRLALKAQNKQEDKEGQDRITPKMNRLVMSLVSQTKFQIKIEIIADEKVIEYQEKKRLYRQNATSEV